MRIAIIGTGHVATTLAPRLVETGHQVVLGSRRPGGQNASQPVVAVDEAVRSVELVVNATPGGSSVEALTAVGPDVYAGKIVLDLANAADANFNLIYPASSLAEELQAALPGAAVVKTLNTAAMSVLMDRSAVPGGSIFVSSDDDQAKRTVVGLLADLGWDGDSVIDLGGLRSARGPEHYFVLFAALMTQLGAPLFNVQIVR
jgi:predicted dinucleotide-binding enzyme